jgi:hypothetical protein
VAETGQVKGASALVTVACKHPAGIIIRGMRKVMTAQQVIGGGVRDVPEYQPTGEQFVIKGYAVPFGEQPNAPVAGGGLIGHALTHGVPRKLFEEWLDANADSELVKRGLIFAADSEHSARDKAKDFAKEKSGLEPLDPKNLPKLSRRFKVETATTKSEAA